LTYRKKRKYKEKTPLFHASHIHTLVYREDLPHWLAIGLALHHLKKTGDAAAWEHAVAEQKDTAQTLHRFTRLAAFIEEHYPAALELGGKFSAGASLMLEFIQLHELSADVARQHSVEVFSAKPRFEHFARYWPIHVALWPRLAVPSPSTGRSAMPTSVSTPSAFSCATLVFWRSKA